MGQFPVARVIFICFVGKRVTRSAYELRKKVATSDWRKLHSVELQKLYSLAKK
jgi:hypothetical protein